MCYSARVWADYRLYVKKFGARIDIQEFVRLLELRAQGEKIVIAKAVTDVFKLDPQSAEERHCRDLVLRYEAEETHRLQEKLFQQRQRLADAERTLETKTTKKATNDKRIATNLIASLREKLEALEEPPRPDAQARVFPGGYCLVMTMDKSGDYLVSPMRYLCRPAGRPAFFDEKYPGCYNARQDNLTGYWKEQYGSTHAVVVASAFFENVKRHRLEGRELAEGEETENVILQFNPGNGQVMQLACLWSRWTAPGKNDLLSFAAITTDPPAEVSAAGHDRCPIPLKDANIAGWLATQGPSLQDYEAMLEDRERPYYEHLLLAA